MIPSDFHLSNRAISAMSSELLKSISELNQIEKGNREAEQQKMFQAFFRVIDSIGNEVWEVRNKYLKLNKEELISEKCEQIAADIKLFREECYFLKKEIKTAKKDRRELNVQNETIAVQIQAISKAYNRKSKQKIRTCTQFDSLQLKPQSAQTIREKYAKSLIVNYNPMDRPSTVSDRWETPQPKIRMSRRQFYNRRIKKNEETQ